MFEQWKEQELAEIKERFGKARLLTIGLMALVGFNMLGSVVMLLDGGGAIMTGSPSIISIRSSSLHVRQSANVYRSFSAGSAMI